MFRDSRGVVHTVSSADPLSDLPGDTASALCAALLRPHERDLGGALERCEAVRELVERWQDAFFAGLPDEVDLAEEGRWAAEAGLSLAEVEASYAEDDDLDDELDDGAGDLDDELDTDIDRDLVEQAVLEALDLRGYGEPAELPDELADLDLTGDEDDLTRLLPEELVSLLERELLLLPMRVRLEALVAAADLVAAWGDLFADHEKLLGHLVLAHHVTPAQNGHEELAHLHATLHAQHGPGHPSG
ncbi:MAG: hypothetical protein JWL64_1943 [Frankiales bacterium]|nr:hypothetical protein [Frankiales bacterium]